MSNKAHISVILPLKLAWEPIYSVPEGTELPSVGDRVLVPFAGRNYLGVVSGTDVVPDEKTSLRVRDIFGIHTSKTPVLPSEIDYWRSLADYYMCSAGEMYKAAYPSAKDELVSPRSKHATPIPPAEQFTLPESLAPYLPSLQCKQRPVLLQAPAAPSLELLLALSHNAVMGGRGVLWLVPEVKMEKGLQQRLGVVFGSSLVLWGSHLTPAKKREAARRIREGENVVLLATRSAIFLPFCNLGLVIVQDEQDSSYKQSSPSPRYNAREAALILARQTHAQVVLQSANPSLDTLYNSISGKFDGITLPPASVPDFEIIDSRAQARMGGMDGLIPRKMSALASAASRPAFFKPSRAMFPKLEELLPDLDKAAKRYNFEGYFFTDDLLEHPLPQQTDFLGVFGVDALLGKMDFRADERALQAVLQAVSQTQESLRLCAVSTREASHPVFSSLSEGRPDALLQERKDFSYPPYTRLVDVVFQDADTERAARMSSLLASFLGAQLPSCRIVPFSEGLRITFRRSASLQEEKHTLLRSVETFKKNNRYVGHIHFDVDPLG